MNTTKITFAVAAVVVNAVLAAGVYSMFGSDSNEANVQVAKVESIVVTAKAMNRA